jgi:hypothetical protein
MDDPMLGPEARSVLIFWKADFNYSYLLETLKGARKSNHK